MSILATKIKLSLKESEKNSLSETLIEANKAADWLSQSAWESKIFRQYDLHYKYYAELKEKFNLGAQACVRVISKVADSYKVDQDTQRKYRPTGSIAYDSRLLTFNLAERTVSIWSVNGRLRKIPFDCSKAQLELLGNSRGESDLAYIDGAFYLSVSFEIEDAPLRKVTGHLGVDRGIVNVATTSDGGNYSGTRAVSLRNRRKRQRGNLQKKGTPSARKRIRKIGRRESRMMTDVNHYVSKAIVLAAEGTNQGICLENLSGIRDRITVRKSQRNTLHSWSFYELQQFIEYKAALKGIPVIYVDPRYSSQDCPACGCRSKKNRQSRDWFKCISCGLAGPADIIAAINLETRAYGHGDGIVSWAAEAERLRRSLNVNQPGSETPKLPVGEGGPTQRQDTLDRTGAEAVASPIR